MKSDNALYRIWIPAKEEVWFCGKNDFNMFRQDAQLPSISTLLANISRQRQID